MAAHNIKTSHSPSRCSIPQVPSRDAQQWHDSTSKSAVPHLDARSTSAHWRRTSVAAHHNIKTSQSPSRRSIPQAPSRDAQQWHDSTSKSAVGHHQRSSVSRHILWPIRFHVICFVGKSSIHCCIHDQGYIQSHFPQVNARGSDFSEIIPPVTARIQTERVRLGHTGVASS